MAKAISLSAIAQFLNPLVRLRRVRLHLVLLSALALGVAGSWSTALAATDPGLGTASAFAVLGGSAVTNTGPSVLNGNLGVWPGTSVTGYPPLVLNGALHQSDAVAFKAQGDLTTAYNSAAGQPVTSDLTGQDLGNKTLIPGVYHFSSSAQLTGPLTLDGQGATHAVFIFQIGSTLTTASASSVSLINGASECDVWWQIGSSATLGTATTFRGNLMALTSITLTTGASIPAGRALARNGAVTLDTNVISLPTGCATGSSPGSGGTPSASPTSGSTVGSSGLPTPGSSLERPPGFTPQGSGPPAVGPPGSPGGPGGPGGPPSASPSPRIPVTAAPPDVSTPNTGRGLMLGTFMVGAGLVLFGIVVLFIGGRKSRKSR